MSVALIIIIAVLIISVVGFFISHFALLRCLFNKFFGRLELDALEKDKLDTPYYDKSRDIILKARYALQELEHKEVETVSFDGIGLVAEYYDFGCDKTAILMHGYHSLSFNNFGYIAESLISKGYNILMPYERAHGKSGGKYTSYGLNEHRDLLTWIDYADKYLASDKFLIYGVSMGAAVVALASEKITTDKVKVLVFDCGFVSFDALFNHIADTMGMPKRLVFPGLKRIMKKELDMTFNDYDVEQALRGDKIPTLFICGDNDEVIPPDGIDRCYSACPADKDKIIVEGAGHTTALPDGGEDALKAFYGFVNKYI